MIKKKIVITSALSLFLLTACDDTQETDQSNVDTSGLESDIFSLTFIDAEIIQSSMETSQGILLTFDLTNTSDENIVPNDIFYNYVAISQTTESAIEYSNTPYHTLDAFGEDADSYNEMVEESRQLHNELLPEATERVRFAYNYKNPDSPVTVIVYHSETNEEEGFYELEID